MHCSPFVFDSSVLKVSTADQFYSAMAHLSVQLLDEKIVDADNLIRVREFGSAGTTADSYFSR